MFKVKVSQQLKTYCEQQGQIYNLGQRYTANGNPEQQLTGIIGQSVVMELFGEKWFDGKNGFDNGVDLVYANKKIDIKTMGRTTDVRKDFTNNFLALQDYFDTDIYIFCSYHKINMELTICGWIDKTEFQQIRRLYPAGSIRNRSDGTNFRTFADLYEIDIKDLHDVQNIDDLKQQLNSLCPIQP